jgi:ligand-binding SRPBCC domain-containing protein
MPKIELITYIKSDIKICFDLSRSIDLHKISTVNTNEKAIDGKVTGLIGLDEFVTWEAKHLGVTQRLTSLITEFKEPVYFKDEQIKGIFKSILHHHYFEEKDNVVIMKDVFVFQSPFGILGQLVNRLFLKNYMFKLLKERNSVIKEYAETDKWKTVLNEERYL